MSPFRTFYILSVTTLLVLFTNTNIAHAQQTPDVNHEDVLLELTEGGTTVDQIPVSVTTSTNSLGQKEITYTKSTQANLDRKITIDLDLAASNSLKNDVRIPNPDGTLFSLKNTKLAPTFRAYFTWAINSHHSIRILYAPFSATQEITPSQDIAFNASYLLSRKSIASLLSV